MAYLIREAEDPSQDTIDHMPYHRMTIERDQLYQQVWTEPIQKLAKRYYLSDRGLGKLCARHGIPVPPRGYWARVAHGQTPKRPPLPPLKPGRPHTIHIERHLKHAPGEEPPPESIPAEILQERHPEHRVTVPDDLPLTHPLVKHARRLLRDSEADDRGILRPPNGCLHIRVSKAAQPRALRIMQALLTAIEARGYSVHVREQQAEPRLMSQTFATVLGDQRSSSID